MIVPARWQDVEGMDWCPRCGSTLSEEARWGLHTNGHWNRRRKFKCGLALSFSPNLMRVSEDERCVRDPSFVEEASRRSRLVMHLRRLISGSAADEEFKGRALMKVEELSRWMRP